jgi:CCR4-NOT complex subunit CAF16
VLPIKRNRSTYLAKPFYLSSETVLPFKRNLCRYSLGLLKPFKVLLCDEITVDLDILGRLDLLAFLADECKERGATVIYATHIFDGMEAWMTHIAFASNGELRYGGAKVGKYA